MRLVPLLAALALVFAVPGGASADPPASMRHHLTLGLGFARHVSDDFEDAGLETGLQGQVAYRYSVSRHYDVCLEGRSFWTSDEEVFTEPGGTGALRNEHETLYFGPGVRWSSGDGPVRPYVQANVYYARETLRIELDGQGGDATEDGAGFGLAAGADIHLSRMFSLPVEANFLYAKPERDVSSLGMQAGITYNFVPLP
jgi:hypothetical protein